jgi:general secretion pathway protein C
MIPNAIFILINLLCITGTAYVGVNAMYDTATAQLSDQPLPERQNVYRPGDIDTGQKPLSAYKGVLDRNLFNTRSKTAPQPQKVDVESLEETKLDLKLWGTVSGPERGDYAVIEDVKARKQNLYRTGDAIQTATLKKIYREKVVLTVNGKDEILQMQKLVSGKGGSRKIGSSARESSPSSSGSVRAQRISLRRSYIEQAMTDMAKLMTQVQIRPHMEDGVPSGLALSSIKPNSIFRRMGLRNGDIITGVDGREISTVNDALGLVENLQNASGVSVQLKRRGREKNIEYSIR